MNSLTFNFGRFKFKLNPKKNRKTAKNLKR